MTEKNSKKPDKERKKLLLIFDGIVSDHNFHKSTSLKKLIVRGRLIKICSLLTFQYLNLIPPVRDNLDCVFVGQMNKQILDLLVS